jgi:YVTN family beta-propeller protein
LNYFQGYTFLFFLYFLCGCTKDVGYVNHGNYPQDIDKLITRNCATSGCHNSQSYQAASGLNLETWSDMFKGATSGSPVIPYSSQFSSLCYFINTYTELGLQNKPTMPYDKTPLSRDEVSRIKAWIDQGAQDAKGNIMWADNPKRKKLYAVNQGCDVVTVFDSETRLPMRVIEVGNKTGPDTPHQLRVSPDGNYWYVIFINNNIMQKFRCSDDSYVGDIPLTPLAAGTGNANDLDWNNFVISKNGRLAYCVSWTQNGRISCVDLENRKFLKYSPVLYFPHGVALNSTEDKVYVAAQTGNFITEIDTGFSNSNSIPLQNGASINFASSLDPHYMILSPDNNNLFITCQKSNEVRVFNIPSATVTNIIPTGVYPQEIVYFKNQYFVSCTEDKTTFPNSNGVITRISANGPAYQTTSIKCGFQPHGIAVDETKNLLYVLSRNILTSGPLPHHTSQCGGKNGFVNFIDLNTFTLLPERYELSVDPYFISARP